MITFNGQTLKCLAMPPQIEAPRIHAQRNQFPGVWGESQILLGVGGRDILISVWLTDASFTTSAAVDAYRQLFDLSVGTTATLQLDGRQPMSDVCFDGFEPQGSILPVQGAGMPAGTYWQAGMLHFHQLTVP